MLKFQRKRKNSIKATSFNGREHLCKRVFPILFTMRHKFVYTVDALQRRYMEHRTTVGKVAIDLQKKESPTHDPIELEREMHKDYEAHMQQAIDRGLKDHPKDFYVVVLTKKERLLENVLRNFFLTRQSCPRPEYDQTVYRYDRATDTIEFLWVIPSKDTCQLFKQNALDIVPEERGLLEYILKFYDGTLDATANTLNGEFEKKNFTIVT